MSATDQPDWSTRVVVESGTVTIDGTATVDIGNTPEVQLASGATVDLASGATVNIAGTPTVDVSGSTIALAAGTAVDIAGTPTVDASGSTIALAAGTAVDIAGTPTVNLTSGATVDIGNTPTVDIASGAEVAIAGTATVDLAAGASVEIASGTITEVTTIKDVTGNVNVQNAPSSSLLTRSVPVSADIINDISSAESGTSPGNTVSIGPSASSYALQLGIMAVVVRSASAGGDIDATVKITADNGSGAKLLGAETQSGSTTGLWLVYWCPTTNVAPAVEMTNNGNAQGANINAYRTQAFFAESASTSFSNDLLVGLQSGSGTWGQLSLSTSLTAAPLSLAVAIGASDSGWEPSTSSPGDIYWYGTADYPIIWYAFAYPAEGVAATINGGATPVDTDALVLVVPQ